jgi:hypothetical protein
MLTRRHFIQTTTALFSASVSSPLLADTWPTEAQKAEWDAQVTPPGFDPAASNPWGLHPRFLPQRVIAKPGVTVPSLIRIAFKIIVCFQRHDVPLIFILYR